MLLAIIISTVILIVLYKLFCGKEKRDYNPYQEQWYGKDPSPLQTDDVKESVEDTSIRAFKINVPDEVLNDLKQRLERTRFEDPVEGSKFLYGFNPNYLRRVTEYWRTQYDWRKHEEELNRFPQFKTCIDGIDVHFVHVKPVIPEGRSLKVLPLLVIHGWPGSFVEFTKILPLLTTPHPDRDFVFEVVCPSIPGYGFSESPHRKGFDAIAAARMFHTLMMRLEHPKFYVQGGDWGSCIASLMARYYSSRIIGVHLNMYFFSPKPWEGIKLLLVAIFPFLVSREEYNMMFPLKKFLKNMYQESGYFHMQSTKPDTLGCAMSDSPAGMAAYLLEKFSVATNPEGLLMDDGGLTLKFTLDELLTNIMIYWVNNNFTAAARFYKENLVDIVKKTHERTSTEVPCGIALFPKEVLMIPKMCMTQQMKNIVSYSIMPRGGHFAAMEEPQLLADDIWKFAGIVQLRR